MGLYSLTTNPNVVIRSDGASIPVDVMDNQDAIDYQAWLQAGNLPDPISITVTQGNALNDLMTLRNSKNAATITVDGKPYFADPDSQNLINQTLSSQERGLTTVFPANWILADGTLLVVQYADLVAVNSALVTRTSANFANYYTLYMQIVAAADPTTVDITQGWS